MVIGQQDAERIARDPWHTTVDPDDVLLTGRVAVVTGAGGGIGQGIALGLARFGADVAVLDIDPERADRTAAAVTELGRGALAIAVDVKDSEAVHDAVTRAADHFGSIGILVNNAGGVRAARFVEQSERSWRRHIDINLVSMLAATSAAAPHLIERGDGAILNVTSIEGFRAAPMYAVYAACKAGMISFTRTLAVELAEHHVRVNAIAPDQTITPGLRGNVSGPIEPTTWFTRDPESVARGIPLGREGVVEDCARAAVYLCSPMASYVTGVTLHVDGGTWASSGWERTKSGWSLPGT